MADTNGYQLGEEALSQIARGLRKINALPIPRPASTRRQQRFASSGTGIGVYNTSGETVPANGIMRIVSATSLDDEVVYEVGKPNTTFGRFYLVNTEEEIANGEYGTGYFLDLAGRALYDSADGTPAYGQVWGPYPSTWKLRRHMYGFHCRGDANTTDTHARFVQERVNGMVIGKADGTISVDSSGTFSVWKGDHSADSTANLTAHCVVAITSTTAWMGLVPTAETWRASPLECQ